MLSVYQGKLHDSNNYINKAGKPIASARLVNDELNSIQIFTDEELLGKRIISLSGKYVKATIDVASGSNGARLILKSIEEVENNKK